ncbi:chymotrypsin-1-like [Pieris brassicae]|uniref:chymotrypsin-1-like n=1 Tax=Pieris brassicae TaxID=7116 RepID=UPI001E65E881|nr:chymotrypsin-1-like [Pieris brassicae]
MLFYLPFLFGSVNPDSVLDNLEGKIVGGKPVKMESFPFSVKFFNHGAMCSGTILNSWSILTAAHCFDHSKDIDEMLIVVGSRYAYDHSAATYEVLRYLIHEDYNKVMPFACDIALIFVTSPISFGKRSEKGLLVNTSKWMNANETHLIATGWGTTKYGGPISELGLMQTELRYVPKKDCERMHKMKFTADMFCLYGEGNRDTCKGDSGGGVLWRRMVIGIVSHGDGCAKKDKPSLYSNVWYFRKWIQKNVEQFVNNFCFNKQTI